MNLFTEASRNAQIVDTDLLFVGVISLLIFLLVFTLVLLFAVRYRRGSAAKRGPLPNILKREFEIGWTRALLGQVRAWHSLQEDGDP